MSHDGGVDFRPDVGFIQGYDYFMSQMKAFTHNENIWQDCHFLRGTRDPSHMHLELLKYNENGGTFLQCRCLMYTDATDLDQIAHLKDPGLNPTWYQKGIARYCIKTPSFADARAMVERRGYKIYIDQQRGKTSVLCPTISQADGKYRMSCLGWLRVVLLWRLWWKYTDFVSQLVLIISWNNFWRWLTTDTGSNGILIATGEKEINEGFYENDSKAHGLKPFWDF